MEIADYKVQLEIFEGPLDLLLYLIKKEELDIHDISIEMLTKQYLSYINTFKLLNIEIASEFIVMASNLMYLKSRTLLPKSVQPPEEESEEDDPRWELIRQLIEYKKFKDAANYLSDREIEQQDYFSAKPHTEKPKIDNPAPLQEASIFDLINAFQNIVKRFEESSDFGNIIDDRYTVSDKMESLLSSFRSGESQSFSSLFQSSSSKMEVIVTFLALLELMKLSQFGVLQDSTLGEIQVHRYDELSH